MNVMKTLVAYFSASGVTKRVADRLAKAIEADIYEIRPKVSYTAADLDWTNRDSRSSVEMKDKKSRPEIVTSDVDVAPYDVVFLGFPIWWYVAPTIINTFLESQNFSNKKIVLLATSGGSGFGRAVEGLRGSVSDSAEIIEGRILNGNPSSNELISWVNELKL